MPGTLVQVVKSEALLSCWCVGVMVTAPQRERPPQRSSAAAARALFAKAPTPEPELDELLCNIKPPAAPLQPRRKRGRPRKLAAASLGDAAALVLKRTCSGLGQGHQPAGDEQVPADESAVATVAAVLESALESYASVLGGGSPTPHRQVSAAAVAAVPRALMGPGSMLGGETSSPRAQVSVAAVAAVPAGPLEGPVSTLGESLPFMLTPLQSGSLGLAAPWSRYE